MPVPQETGYKSYGGICTEKNGDTQKQNELKPTKKVLICKNGK